MSHLNENTFTYGNDLTKSMQDLLNERLKGKSFVYRSKYGGETFGEIECVIVSSAMTWDKASTTNFTNRLDWMKRFNRKDKTPPELVPITNYYRASRPTINIRSTKGISYQFDEIFIIENN